ncbi:hypothetical protein ACFL5C_00480 [Candidatus Omnitrophota bacterium]
MNTYKLKYRIWFKIVATAVVCLFFLNTISSANPTVDSIASHTLAPPLGTKPPCKIVNGLRTEIEFNMKDLGADPDYDGVFFHGEYPFSDYRQESFRRKMLMDPVFQRITSLISLPTFEDLTWNSYDSFIDKIKDLGIDPEEFTGTVTLEVFYEGTDVVVNVIDNGKTIALDKNGMPIRRKKSTKSGHFGGGGAGTKEVKRLLKLLHKGTVKWYPIKGGTKTQIRIPRKKMSSSFSIRDNERIVLNEDKEQITQKEFLALLICKLIEKRANYGKPIKDVYLDDILLWKNSTERAFEGCGFEALPSEINIHLPESNIIVRYYDPTKADPITPFSDTTNLKTVPINTRLNRQIIHTVEVLPLTPKRAHPDTGPKLSREEQRKVLGKIFVHTDGIGIGPTIAATAAATTKPFDLRSIIKGTKLIQTFTEINQKFNNNEKLQLHFADIAGNYSETTDKLRKAVSGFKDDEFVVVLLNNFNPKPPYYKECRIIIDRASVIREKAQDICLEYFLEPETYEFQFQFTVYPQKHDIHLNYISIGKQLRNMGIVSDFFEKLARELKKQFRGMEISGAIVTPEGKYTRHLMKKHFKFKRESGTDIVCEIDDPPQGGIYISMGGLPWVYYTAESWIRARIRTIKLYFDVVRKIENDIEKIMSKSNKSRRRHVRSVIDHYKFFKEKEFDKLYQAITNDEVKRRTEEKEYYKLLKRLHAVYQELAGKEKRALDLAIILHDVGYNHSGGIGHVEKGSEMVGGVLRKYNITDEEMIKNIHDIVKYHQTLPDIGVQWLPSDFPQHSPSLKKQLLIMTCMDSVGKVVRSDPSKKDSILSSQLLKETFDMYENIDKMTEVQFLSMRIRTGLINRPVQISRAGLELNAGQIQRIEEEAKRLKPLYPQNIKFRLA